MNKSKRLIASILAAAMIVPAAVNLAVPMTASAYEMLGESDFDHKVLPWHVVSASPAKQEFRCEDGEMHIWIITPIGQDKERYDLQFRHRNLNFKQGHTYEVSFKAKAQREGMELYSAITNIRQDKFYFSSLRDGSMVMGPDMGGRWGETIPLTTEYQTYSGTFIPTEDLENVQWTMQYARGENYGGNAQAGDEIWFDEMHIKDLTGDPGCTIGEDTYYTDRQFSGMENNYISVNQLGYYPELAKIATLGDNSGSMVPDADTIELTAGMQYAYEIVDVSSNETVYTGKTGPAQKDKDSDDLVCKIDFSEFKEKGVYYLRIKDTDWRSFRFRIGDDIYQDEENDMLTNALSYFFQNRSGIDIEGKYVSKPELAHPGSHIPDNAYVQDSWVDTYFSMDDARVEHKSSVINASGGWYDAKYHSKNLVNGGYSVWMLQNMYERAAKTAEGKEKFADGSGTCIIPETDNQVPDVLDECRWELEYMHQMKVDPTEPTWGDYAGLYYHSLQDHVWTGLAVKPWDYAYPQDEGGWGTVRIVKPPTLAATLNYAACAAQAARLWKEYDAEYAESLFQSAIEAYQAFRQYYYDPDFTTALDPRTHTEVAKENLNEKSLYAPMNQKEHVVPFGDLDVMDDAYWAACELFVTDNVMGKGDGSSFYKDLSDYENAFKVPTRIRGGSFNAGAAEGSYNMLNVGNVEAAGTLTLALHRDLLGDNDRAKLEKSICDTANSFIGTEQKQGYGIPYLYDGPGYLEPTGVIEFISSQGFEEGSNARALTNMMAMAYAYDLTKEAKYINGVAAGMDYLLGNNPLAFSYITGYGFYHLNNPTHRFWSHELDKSIPAAPDGVLSGGAAVEIADEYMKLLGYDAVDCYSGSERFYADSVEATFVNSAALEYNAPLAWIVSFMQDEAPKFGKEADISKSVVWGDVNDSGETDVSDAVLLARFLAEDKECVISTQGQKNANVVSGELNHDDLIAILMSIAKLIDGAKFPIDKLPTA